MAAVRTVIEEAVHIAIQLHAGLIGQAVQIADAVEHHGNGLAAVRAEGGVRLALQVGVIVGGDQLILIRILNHIQGVRAGRIAQFVRGAAQNRADSVIAAQAVGIFELLCLHGADHLEHGVVGAVLHGHGHISLGQRPEAGHFGVLHFDRRLGHARAGKPPSSTQTSPRHIHFFMAFPSFCQSARNGASKECTVTSISCHITHAMSMAAAIWLPLFYFLTIKTTG